MTQRRVVTFDDDVIGVHRETTTRKMAASVSCGNYRCLQERKQLRKELEKSRKQFISSIGFECVVKELYGVESVKRITPFNDEDAQRETEDWDPSFAEICQLCMARKQLVKESIARHERYIDEYTGNWETKGDVSDGQPLDLSRAGCDDDRSTDSPLSLATPRKNQSSIRVPFIKVKNKSKLARHGKTGTYSNYTQSDLKLALIDVRSGKIGTRRASVLYGIPRSTIRNHLNRNSFLNDDETGANNNRSSKRISPKVEANLKDSDKPKKPLPQDTNSYGSICFTKDGEDVISRLRKHLEEVEKCKTRIDGKQTVGRLLLQEMLSGQTNKAKDLDDNNKMNHESSLPKSVFEYLIEKHLENVNEIDGENRENIQSQKTKSGQVDPNLKVPDFKPVNGASDKDKPFVIEETRNNAAVINEWFKRSASPLMDMTSQEHDSVANSTGGRSVSSEEYNTGQSKRPKRGRYRCYDRESLMQAVNAVQRGEMTVTRAGNVFGVPHSTLEYKVKERHLKRNTKRTTEEKPQTSAAVHSDHSDTNQSSQAPEIFKPQRLGPAAAMMYPIGGTIIPSYDSFASRLRAISERQLWHSMFPYPIDPEALRHLSESASHYYRSHPLYPGQFLDEEYYLLNERQSTSLGLHPPPTRESVVNEPRTDRDSVHSGTFSHSSPVKQEVKREKSSNINNIIEKLLEAQIYQQVKNIQEPESSPTQESKQDKPENLATEEKPAANDLSTSARKRPTEEKEEEKESIPTKKSCHDDAENPQKITENIGAIPV